MLVAVNVLLYLMSGTILPLNLCNGGDVVYFGCFCFKGELGFLDSMPYACVLQTSFSSLFLTLFMLT